MEAIALHSFTPEKPDELGFKKGSTLYVINIDEEPDWYRARQDKREGLVPKNYLQMLPHQWFIPKCSRLEAEARLAEKDPQTGHFIQPDGAFILRPSENNPGQFSISVKAGVFVLHFRVFYEEPGSYFIWTSKFSSINKLIEHHRSSTIYGLRNLLLTDCVPSLNFGPVGAGSPYKGASNGSAGPHRNPSGITTYNSNTGPHSNAMDGQSFAPDANRGPTTQMDSMSRVKQQQKPSPNNNNQSQSMLPPGLARTSRTGLICQAMYDFQPGYKEEMGFKRGDKIRIIAEEDENWWLGEILNPKTNEPLQPPVSGLFPSNYVQMLNDRGVVAPPQQPTQQTGRMIEMNN